MLPLVGLLFCTVVHARREDVTLHEARRQRHTVAELETAAASPSQKEMANGSFKTKLLKARRISPKASRARDSFFRLGGLTPTDFSSLSGSTPWMQVGWPSAALFHDYRSVLMPCAQWLNGQSLDEGDPAMLLRNHFASDFGGLPAFCGFQYASAFCMSGLDDTLDQVTNVRQLVDFQRRLYVGSGMEMAVMERIAIDKDAGTYITAGREGDDDVTDRDSKVGWKATLPVLEKCSQEACTILLATPRFQSVVYGYRSWYNHQNLQVNQLLVADGARFVWLDFRTLQDYVKFADSFQTTGTSDDDNPFGLFLLTMLGFQQNCPAAKGFPTACVSVEEGDYYEYTDDVEEDEEENSEFKQWKTWRDRAALVAPTDFLKAKLLNHVVRTYHQQVGPVCGAMAVANVMNGLMHGWFVDVMDVFEYFNVKANTEPNKRFGEGRRIYNSEDRLTTKFTANSCLVNAFLNVRKIKPYTALAYQKNLKPKDWYVNATQNQQANFILSKVTAKILLKQEHLNGLKFHKASGKSLKEKHSWMVDNDRTITLEWQCLKVWLDHCITGACGMIFHLPNHWAPIYGYREIKNRRQLLVPSAGQNPVFWQDYRTVRETLGAAKGYNIFVAYTSSPQFPKDIATKCR